MRLHYQLLLGVNSEHQLLLHSCSPEEQPSRYFFSKNLSSVGGFIKSIKYSTISLYLKGEADSLTHKKTLKK